MAQSDGMRISLHAVAFAIPLLLPASCSGPTAPSVQPEIVAESERQWTGVAITPDGRVFVNYPRWGEGHVRSVALLDGKGGETSYPDERWNSWTPETADGKDPARHFICVQSVHVDDQGMLWVLDPANPFFGGVVEGGPKLVKIDPESGSILQIHRFSAEIAPEQSYLNDVRVDTLRGFAYISESGLGSLIVVDLTSGRSRRLLADHPSAKAEPIEIVIEGRRWQRNGTTPEVHLDGIALSPDREHVYFQALTGRSLFRVPTGLLRDFTRSERAVAASVERVSESLVVDGILFGKDGMLYLSALESSAVYRRRPSGEIEQVFYDPELVWPDSFAQHPSGSLYLTTAQIHRAQEDRGPYRLWRFTPLP